MILNVTASGSVKTLTLDVEEALEMIRNLSQAVAGVLPTHGVRSFSNPLIMETADGCYSPASLTITVSNEK